MRNIYTPIKYSRFRRKTTSWFVMVSEISKAFSRKPSSSGLESISF